MSPVESDSNPNTDLFRNRLEKFYQPTTSLAVTPRWSTGRYSTSDSVCCFTPSSAVRASRRGWLSVFNGLCRQWGYQQSISPQK